MMLGRGERTCVWQRGVQCSGKAAAALAPHLVPQRGRGAVEGVLAHKLAAVEALAAGAHICGGACTIAARRM